MREIRFAWLPTRTVDGVIWLRGYKRYTTPQGFVKIPFVPEKRYNAGERHELESLEAGREDPVTGNYPGDDIIFSEQLHGVHAKHLGDIPAYQDADHGSDHYRPGDIVGPYGP